MINLIESTQISIVVAFGLLSSYFFSTYLKNMSAGTFIFIAGAVIVVVAYSLPLITQLDLFEQSIQRDSRTYFKILRIGCIFMLAGIILIVKSKVTRKYNK